MPIRNTSKRLTLALATGVLLACAHTHAADNPVRLNFGVYSSNKPSAMVRLFKPTLNALESRMQEHLGREVDIRMQIAKDYDQGISDLTSGRVDFSRFGPASYIEANRMNDAIQILAMENIKNAKVFYGIIAVHEDSPIKSIDELRDKRFAFGDEGSTIGRFLSQLYLERNGIRAQDLSGYEYLGRHDKVGTAVGAGAYDAGALNESTFKKLVDKGEKIRELARFPNVTKPWIARSNLDAEVFTALQKSLLDLADPASLKALKVDGFLEGSDEDYAEIRRAMDKNHLFFEKNKSAPRTPLTASTKPVAPAVAAPASAMPTAPQMHINTVADVVRESATSHEPSVNVTSHAMHPHHDNCSKLEINLSLPMSLVQKQLGNGHQSISINLQFTDDTQTGAQSNVVAK